MRDAVTAAPGQTDWLLTNKPHHLTAFAAIGYRAATRPTDTNVAAGRSFFLLGLSVKVDVETIANMVMLTIRQTAVKQGCRFFLRCPLALMRS